MTSEVKHKYYCLLKKWYDPVILVLSFLLILVIVIPEINSLPPNWNRMFVVVDWIIWVVFMSELVLLSYLSGKPFGYIKRNWIDLVVVVLSIPFLLSIFRFARLFRLLRVFAIFIKALGEARTFFVRHNFLQIFSIAIAMIVVLGVLGFLVEQESTNANITTFDKGIWWAITTVTTVGYGDQFPVTFLGKTIGVVLMIMGITVYSIFIANVSSFFVIQEQAEEKKEEVSRLTIIEERLDDIEESMKRLESSIKTIEDMLLKISRGN